MTLETSRENLKEKNIFISHGGNAPCHRINAKTNKIKPKIKRAETTNKQKNQKNI